MEWNTIQYCEHKKLNTTRWALSSVAFQLEMNCAASVSIEQTHNNWLHPSESNTENTKNWIPRGEHYQVLRLKLISDAPLLFRWSKLISMDCIKCDWILRTQKIEYWRGSNIKCRVRCGNRLRRFLIDHPNSFQSIASMPIQNSLDKKLNTIGLQYHVSRFNLKSIAPLLYRWTKLITIDWIKYNPILRTQKIEYWRGCNIKCRVSTWNRLRRFSIDWPNL
jgi:hypothetical protein